MWVEHIILVARSSVLSFSLERLLGKLVQIKGQIGVEAETQLFRTLREQALDRRRHRMDILVRGILLILRGIIEYLTLRRIRVTGEKSLLRTERKFRQHSLLIRRSSRYWYREEVKNLKQQNELEEPAFYAIIESFYAYRSF